MAILWSGIVYTLEGIAGILANTFIIIVLCRSKDLMSRDSSKFILNQCAIDTVTSVLLVTSYSNLVRNFGIAEPAFTDNRVGDEILCKIWNADLFQWAFIVSSTANLVILTIERYIKIVHPMWYKVKIGEKTIIALLIAPWVIGPILQISFFIIVSDVRNNSCMLSLWPSETLAKSIGIISFIIQFFIPIMVMLYCYLRIYKKIQKRWKKMEVYSVGQRESSTETTSTCASNETVNSAGKIDGNGTKEVNNKPKVSFDPESLSASIPDAQKAMNRQIQRKIIKTLIIVSVAFFLCWVCNQVMFFLGNLGVINFMEIYGTPFYYFTVIAAYSNCWINPAIYVSQYSGFRKFSCRCPGE